MPAKTEDQTRKAIMDYAKSIGAEEDLKQLFAKWDRLIALAPENEKVPMSRQAILEVQSLLDIHPETGDGLTINDEEVIAAAPEHKKWKSWKGSW